MVLLLSSCVQKTKNQVIHISVDTRGASELNSLEVRGGLPPLSWKEGLILTDSDSNGIYTGTVTLDIPYKYVELKFVKNGDIYELEGQPNRQVYFDEDGKTNYEATFNKM